MRIFYYELSNIEDGKKYGGFVEAKDYGDAATRLEKFFRDELEYIDKLIPYDEPFIILPKDVARFVKQEYDKNLPDCYSPIPLSSEE